MSICKKIAGLHFEFDSPCALHLVGLPVSIVYDGQYWWLSCQGDNHMFKSRMDAIHFLRDSINRRMGNANPSN